MSMAVALVVMRRRFALFFFAQARASSDLVGSETSSGAIVRSFSNDEGSRSCAQQVVGKAAIEKVLDNAGLRFPKKLKTSGTISW